MATTMEALMIRLSFPRTVLAAAFVAALGLGSTVPAAAQDQVNVRFSWKLKGEYGPLYYAQEHGLFKNENLSVRMRAGGARRTDTGTRGRGDSAGCVRPERNPKRHPGQARRALSSGDTGAAD